MDHGTLPSKAPTSAVAALAGPALAMLLASLGTSIANVALPTFAESFGAGFGDVQWVVLAYLLAVTSLIVGAGRLGDAFGRRRVLLGGILLFTAASAVCGLSPDLELLIAARFAQGAGAAVMMALALAITADSAAKGRMGGAMGLLGAMSALGTALGPSLGGLFIAVFGWRSIFFLSIPLGLAAFAATWRGLPVGATQPTQGRARFDWVGTFLLASTLAAYALAVTTRQSGFGAINLALLLAALVGLMLFVRVQGEAVSPLIPPAMLRAPRLSSGLAMSAIVSTVMMTTLVVGPFYMSGALGLGPALVGLAMSAGPAIVALAGVPVGRAVDRFGADRTTVAGLVAMAVACLLLSLPPAATGLAGYLPPIALLTLGYALFQTANNKAVMAACDPKRRGVTSGVLNLSRNLGLITGASAMGSVFALASAWPDIPDSPQALAAGLRITFAVAALLTCGALAISIKGCSTTRRTASGPPLLVSEPGALPGRG